MDKKYWSDMLERLDLTPDGAWLVYLVGLILIVVAVFLKNQLSWREKYITFGVLGYLGWLGNIVFFYQLDLLDSGKPSIGSVPDLIMFGFAPAAGGIIFSHFYSAKPTWRIGMIFAVLSLLMEYILVKVGFLTLKGWRLWYSIPFYLGLFLFFLPWHLRFIRRKK